MTEKRQYVLWAESIREIGILLFVFGPLETLLRKAPLEWEDWLTAAGIGIIGLILISVAVKVEADQ